MPDALPVVRPIAVEKGYFFLINQT